MRVLLLRAGALGDLLLLRRTVAALQAAGHRVSLLAPDVGRALVGSGRGEAEDLLPWGAPETARLLGGETTDGPVCASLRATDTLIAYTRSSDVTRALSAHTSRLIAHDPTPPAGVHASRWLCEPLVWLGIAEWPDPPLLLFTDREKAEAARLVSSLPPRFLALHPGSGSPTKNWPAERFDELARRLAPGERWLLTLGPAEDAVRWTAVAGALVAREVPVRVLGAALSGAGLYVGNDSGVSHLAAAVGAPTLALFGPTDPACWAPVGPRVLPLRAGDLAQLDVTEVEHAARSLLESRRV